MIVCKLEDLAELEHLFQAWPYIAAGEGAGPGQALEDQGGVKETKEMPVRAKQVLEGGASSPLAPAQLPTVSVYCSGILPILFSLKPGALSSRAQDQITKRCLPSFDLIIQLYRQS